MKYVYLPQITTFITNLTHEKTLFYIINPALSFSQLIYALNQCLKRHMCHCHFCFGASRLWRSCIFLTRYYRPRVFARSYQVSPVVDIHDHEPHIPPSRQILRCRKLQCRRFSAFLSRLVAFARALRVPEKFYFVHLCKYRHLHPTDCTQRHMLLKVSAIYPSHELYTRQHLYHCFHNSFGQIGHFRF